MPPTPIVIEVGVESRQPPETARVTKISKHLAYRSRTKARAIAMLEG